MKKRVTTIFITSLLMLSIFSVAMTTKANGEPTSTTQNTNSSNNTSVSSYRPSVQWNRTYNFQEKDKLGWAIQTSDGGYALAGTTEASFSSTTPRNSLLIKTNANGDVQWYKTYGKADRIYSLIQTSDGGYAITGISYSATIDAGLFIKTDSSGNIQLNKTYPFGDNFDIYKAIPTTDDGYLLAGICDISSGWRGGLLVKINASGDEQWYKTYEIFPQEGFCAIQTTDGGYALSGSCSVHIGSSYHTEASLIKTDSNGNMQWNRTYGEDLSWANSVIQTTDGGYVLAGGTLDYESFGNIWLIRTDTNGNIQWNKTYTGYSAKCVIQTTDSGYLMVGEIDQYSTNNDLMLIKTDMDGNVDWERTSGGAWDDYAVNCFQTSDGGYAYTGTIKFWYDVSDTDFWLIKLVPESIASTELRLNILDRNKWHTNVNVPFNIDGAEDYIDNFENNGKPPADFGSVPLNIEIQNFGNVVAKNVVCDCNISGIAVMIHLSGESLAKDKKVLYPFNDSISKTIGSIDKGVTQAVALNISLKYMSIIAGELTLDKGSDWVEPFKIDVLLLLGELEIKLKVSATNCQSVEGQTRLFAVGDPKKLTDVEYTAIKKRLENEKEEALKRLLEMHIGVLASGVKSTDYSLDVGLHRITQTLDPKTSGVNIGAIIPQGLKLIGLTVIIKELVSGLTSTLSISSSAVPGFAMIVFPDVYKLLPKGVLSTEITLETQQVNATVFALVAQQSNDVSLTVTEIIAPDLFEVSWKGNNYHIAIASNATISNFTFLDSPGAAIRFNVTEFTNGTYFYKATIPNDVIRDDFEVWCDGNQINNFELTQNTTHSFLYFTYQDFIKGNHEMTIVPEYTSLVALLMFMIIPILAVIQRKHSRRLL